jgi:uncharacterized membrane protein (UPF0127 family)
MAFRATSDRRPWQPPAVRVGVSAAHAFVTTLVLAGIALAACSGDDTPAASSEMPDDAGSASAAVAIPPAATIPAGLNDVELPVDVEPLDFSFTRVELTGADRVPRLMAMLVADNFERRTRGLMFRDELPLETGMIFAFPAPTNSPFWNKDTPLDLDLALLSAEGEILEIRILVAFDTELVTPTVEYSFAVELPQGWFDANSYSVGDRFSIPEGVVGLTE